MKKNSKKIAQEIINSNDTEKNIINDIELENAFKELGTIETKPYALYNSEGHVIQTKAETLRLYFEEKYNEDSQADSFYENIIENAQVSRFEENIKAAKKIEAAKPVIMVQKKNISNRAVRTTDNKSRNYQVIVSGLILGIDKKQMMQDMEKAGWKPITAKSFVNSVACVYKAIKGESRKIDGIVYIATQALLNNEAMPKWGDANSKNYVENVVKAYRALTAK